uniref:Ras and Rab interactor 3 n=1 Tax=Sphenodon punctatus TaxID=8508 RepID=A0A8D0H2C3_SPHPU
HFTLPNCLPLPGISVLDKLIKTCPVWLQLSMNHQRACEILSKEAGGVFLVRREENLKNMVLSVHFPAQNGTSEVQEYNIKEEKSLLYLEGSVLVFEDIFKLVAFYCVSRDLLPFTLRLPQAILEANSSPDLETISGLGIGKSLLKQLGSNQCFASSTNHCSCEIELSLGNDRLWFVNPIFIEEFSKPPSPDVPPPERNRACLPLTSDTTPSSTRSPRRPPPPPPPLPHAQILKKHARPAIPPRRRFSERLPDESCDDKVGKCEKSKGEKTQQESCTKSNTNDSPYRKVVGAHAEVTEDTSECPEPKSDAEERENMHELQRWSTEKAKLPPIPPPRKKRLSQQQAATSSSHSAQTKIDKPQQISSTGESPPRGDATYLDAQHELGAAHKSVGSTELKGSHGSLDCSVGSLVTQTFVSEPDSYSTSSTEDDLEQLSSPSVKKTHSMILGKAKHRLSFVSLTNVFTVFLSADRKLQKKIVELVQDKEDSYFGNLVQDYKVYSLEMMAKQNSSTEMLQEIRLMMTQLKSYLIQSTELKSLIDQTVHTNEQLGRWLPFTVLKPLKDAIYTYLREIHSRDGSLQLLKENQLVIQSTTTTDLGVTTSVPETTVLEKILHKFTTMHKAYSPEKKIAVLLKSCKLIYDSMAQGNPGKPYGADDFLPVLMYVLARSNLTEVLLNVEYMMELMDPALQLGEGSYYLTTTYGALEHIKNYDKITVTRQLSTEVQDSIHRWERRRTLNKARASRSSVQVSNSAQLGQQCAERFEVLEPQNYGLFVQVDNKCLQLADDALPHHIKTYLLQNEPKRDFHFIYKQIGREEAGLPVIKEPDCL